MLMDALEQSRIDREADTTNHCRWVFRGHRPVEFLSAMRHFGVPSRLLDWTYSPYVALYSALEEQSEKKFAAVWALDIGALQRASSLKVLPVKELPDGTRVRPPVRYVDFGEDEVLKSM